MDLLEQIKEAGIIGAGGAGFPTHAKLTGEAEFILMNAAECEPLLRVDQQLLSLYTDDILTGFEAAGRLVKAKEAIIGIKGKHKGVIQRLEERIKALHVEDYIKIHELRDVYPAGDEQVLVYELTGRIVPETGIPLKVGCVVINVETTLNIFRASKGKSVTDTYVTVAGDVPHPITLKVPVGTAIAEVLKATGIDKIEDYTVIDGGPMMGPLLADINGYVTKKSKGYVILKKDHYLIRKKSMTAAQERILGRSACEQCRMCTDLCPRYLLGHDMQPHKLMRDSKYNIEDLQAVLTAQLCSQCGLCALFACPANLQPKLINNYYKDKLGAAKLKYKPVKESYKAREARDYRLVPIKRLIARLGLREFDKPAALQPLPFRPDYVNISLRQHIGAPSQAVVAVGDSVERGQLIGAIPENSLGATVHASMSGKVTEVTNNSILIKVG